MNIFSFVILCLYALSYQCSADTAEEILELSTTIGPSNQFQCVNGTIHLNDEVQERVDECRDPEKFGMGENKKHPNCAAFCLTKAVGALGEDGLPSKDLYEKWITESFPEEFQTLAIEHISTCWETHHQFDITDEKCVEAAAFSSCAWKLQTKLTCEH